MEKEKQLRYEGSIPLPRTCQGHSYGLFVSFQKSILWHIMTFKMRWSVKSSSLQLVWWPLEKFVYGKLNYSFFSCVQQFVKLLDIFYLRDSSTQRCLMFFISLLLLLPFFLSVVRLNAGFPSACCYQEHPSFVAAAVTLIVVLPPYLLRIMIISWVFALIVRLPTWAFSVCSFVYCSDVLLCCPVTDSLYLPLYPALRECVFMFYSDKSSVPQSCCVFIVANPVHLLFLSNHQLAFISGCVCNVFFLSTTRWYTRDDFQQRALFWEHACTNLSYLLQLFAQPVVKLELYLFKEPGLFRLMEQIYCSDWNNKSKGYSYLHKSGSSRRAK